MKAGDVFFLVILYFAYIFVFEWIFGKFFWPFDSLLFLLKQQKFLSAIFLILTIYVSSLIMIAGMMENASKDNKAAVLVICIVLFLMAGDDIYSLWNSENFDDAFGTVIKIVIEGSYTEILQLIAVVHGSLRS